VFFGDGRQQPFHAEGVPHQDQSQEQGGQNEPGQDQQNTVSEAESDHWEIGCGSPRRAPRSASA